MAVSYKNNSIYGNTRLNSKYLEYYVPPITISYENTKEITLTAKHNLRPDVLALELYGDADYWWVFVLFNRNAIVDPIFDFKTGVTLRVPINTSSIGV